jgi:hypothetical protein
MMRLLTFIRINIMERFLQKHNSRIVGVLSGFDRMLFRGVLRSITFVNGMQRFLCSQHVFTKDFGRFAKELSSQLKEHAQAVAARAKRPYLYLSSTNISKEDLVQSILERDGITEGLVCVLACVESCQSFGLRRDQERKWLSLATSLRKGLYVYFYYVDHEFGLLHIRLQTWLPCPVQICLNGREYLARQLAKAGIGYQKHDNCFTHIDDLPRAQQIMDRLARRKWPRLLKTLARSINPLVGAKCGLSLRDYYWTLRQGEWATDVLFGDAGYLQEIYPALVQHALVHFSCRRVLRFLGRRTTRGFVGKACSNYQDSSEGISIKHWVDENSIKMYNKAGNLLRIETTINNPRRFYVRRWVTRKGRRCLIWAQLRKGVVDLPRRAEIAHAANQRYLQALALVNPPQPVRRILDPISQRIVHQGRPYRALRPITKEEANIFRILLDGAFHIQGFRNADLRRILDPGAEGDPVRRRQSAGRITRYLRLLRAHGLIRKVTHTRYYRATNRGIQAMTTAIHLRQSDLRQYAA